MTIKSYPVSRTSDNGIALTGKGDDPMWKDAHMLSDFHYPWEAEVPPLTTFKALHNNEWFYCLFDVSDTNIHVHVERNDKRDVVSSDRVEIFFRIDEKLSPYYCLEIDPQPRVLDYIATFYRKFDISWTWPADSLVVKSNVGSGGYTVELGIRKDSLRKLGVLTDLPGNNAMRTGSETGVIEAGLYRAECTQSVDPQDHMRWISWIRPDSDTPDFHIPSSFGILRLLD